MNHFRKLIALVLAGILLCGCTTSYYRDEDLQALQEQCTPMFVEYFESLGTPYEMSDRHVVTGRKEDQGIYEGYYLSDVMQCGFQAEGSRYTAYVNIKTGELWSDWQMPQVNAAMREAIKPYCEQYGFAGDFEIKNFGNAYSILCKDVPVSRTKKVDTVAEFDGVLPVGMSDADIQDYAEQYAAGGGNQFWFYYDEADMEQFTEQIVEDYLQSSQGETHINVRICAVKTDELEHFRSSGVAPDVLLSASVAEYDYNPKTGKLQ